MLFITLRNERACAHTKPTESLVWHIGEPNPLKDVPERVAQVIEVQADGDELGHIANTFTNVPMAKKNTVRWHGDIAKFIAQNL